MKNTSQKTYWICQAGLLSGRIAYGSDHMQYAGRGKLELEMKIREDICTILYYCINLD